MHSILRALLDNPIQSYRLVLQSVVSTDGTPGMGMLGSDSLLVRDVQLVF